MAFFRTSIQCNYSSMAAIVKIVFFLSLVQFSNHNTDSMKYLFITLVPWLLSVVWRAIVQKKAILSIIFFLSYLKTKNISWNDLKSIYRCFQCTNTIAKTVWFISRLQKCLSKFYPRCFGLSTNLFPSYGLVGMRKGNSFKEIAQRFCVVDFIQFLFFHSIELASIDYKNLGFSTKERSQIALNAIVNLLKLKRLLFALDCLCAKH